MILTVKCGVRTHAHFRVPELKSGALDRSANLTSVRRRFVSGIQEIRVSSSVSFHLFFLTSQPTLQASIKVCKRNT